MHQPERIAHIAHIEHTLERYKRDLGLMTGRLTPSPTDIDDGAIMDRLAWSEDQHGLISDRRLRIKTLEAMLQLLRERNGG